MQNELLELATKVALKAGQILQERPADFDVTQKSSAVDFATQMDKKSEQFIVEALLAARPNDGILAEEGASKESSSGITWIIDPLDGTVNYFYDLPGWNVSIAAADEAGVQVGVVNAPTINSLWSGVKGGGSFHNGRKIKVADQRELIKSLVISGFSYDLNHRQEQGEILAQLITQVRDVRRLGAAAVDLCHIAMGRADIYFEYGLQPWDRAAGVLIAREAGAVATNWSGAEPDYEMVICANPILHQVISEKLNSIRSSLTRPPSA